MIATGGKADVLPATAEATPRARAVSHYPFLDGLRGFAAVSVVLFHLGHWLHVPGLAGNAGLAVDFFFCLSGYVLALAYEARLRAGMTAASFMRTRLIRLLPLTVLATVVSFTFILLRVAVKHEPVPMPQALLALGLGLANLPFLGAPEAIGGPQVFPLNGPQYTLFLELLVNLVWVAGRRAPAVATAIVFVAASLVGVLALGFGGDDTATFWRGVPRVALSFFLGVAAFHLGVRAKGALMRGPVLALAVIVMAALLYTPPKLPFAVYVVWVVALSPLVVVSGAGVRPGPKTATAALFLGRLSYPIYVLHYPIFCWVNGVYQVVFKRQDAAVESVIVLAAVAVGSLLALRLYDEPVRRWLSRRLAGAGR